MLLAGQTRLMGLQELADLEIRAPFKGVVISKDAQPGEMVSPMSAGGGQSDGAESRAIVASIRRQASS